MTGCGIQFAFNISVHVLQCATTSTDKSLSVDHHRYLKSLKIVTLAHSQLITIHLLLADPRLELRLELVHNKI